MKYGAFDKRMKKYEFVSRNYLTTRTPVIIRIDGKAFHTFTRGFKRPFDDVLSRAMQETMKYLCENIQGCVLGYTQSDEITLVLVDYKTIDTSAWFDYNIQKCASIAASMATLAFNEAFRRLSYLLEAETIEEQQQKRLRQQSRQKLQNRKKREKLKKLNQRKTTNPPKAKRYIPSHSLGIWA